MACLMAKEQSDPHFPRSASRGALVLAWTRAYSTAEEAAEVRNIAEPALLGGLSDCRVTVCEKPLRVSHARLDQVFNRAHAEAFAIKNGKAALSQPSEGSHSLHRP